MQDTTRTLENINETLHSMCISNDKRMTHLESRIIRTEKDTKVTIKKEIEEKKEEIVDYLREDILAIVDARTKELELRK